MTPPAGSLLAYLRERPPIHVVLRGELALHAANPNAILIAPDELALLTAAVEAAQQFRSVFYVDDHEYGERARETYQAVRQLDLALEAIRRA